jgi:hypothetical protein
MAQLYGMLRPIACAMTGSLASAGMGAIKVPSGAIKYSNVARVKPHRR